MSRPCKPTAAPAAPSAADFQRAMDMVALWSPKLRRMAGIYNLPEVDVQSVARDLVLAVRPGADFVPRWLEAVEIQARKERPGAVIGGPEKEVKRKKSLGWGLGWAGGQDFGHAGWRLEALERIEEELAQRGMTIEAALDMPRTARELARALGKSERQARRDMALLRELEGVQGDFWGVPV